MFCKTCGTEIPDDANFCFKCGSSFEFADKKQERFAKIKSNKKIIIIAVVILCAVIITSLASYLNSVSYLEKRLTGNTWYSEPYSGYDNKTAKIFCFYSNGKFNSESYSYYKSYGEDDFGWWSNGKYNYSWELLEDKTLYLRDHHEHYLEYGKDWSFSDGKLIITIPMYHQTYTFHQSDMWGYSKQ